MNYIDLSCPVEVFSSALPTEQIPAATVTLFNLSDRVIASVEVSLRLLDRDGAETERLAFRGRALNGRPHSTFLMTVPCAPSKELKSLEVTVEKIWYADNETWRRDPAAAVPYTPNTLPVSPALTNLKYVAGETAVGYPSLQDGLWLCVCGRPNPEGEPYCVRCGRPKETVFACFTPEVVEAQINMKERQLDLSSRNMREDTIRLQRLREEEYQRKKVRRGNRVRIAGALVFTLALVAVVLFIAEPWLRYGAGVRALETGNPAGAKEVFASLGAFGGAQEQIAECDWQIALAAAENASTAEELAAASGLLRAVKDRPEAADKANEVDLLRCRLLLGNNEWSEAQQVLALLPEDYEGRAELERSCLTAQAWAYQNMGVYDRARDIWLALGDDVPGAKEQANVCVYEPAMYLMEIRDWDNAISMLAMIPDYADSRDKTLECHFRKAQELLDAGDREGASREFLLAGNWGTAAEKYHELVYARAKELYDAGDLKGAQELFASIPDYSDANDKNRECSYRLAEQAADVLEYSTVLEKLKDIPDSYKRTRQLRAEAAYQKAKIAVKQEDWQTAAELLAGVDRDWLKKKYRDVESVYLKACEKAGIDPYPTEAEPDDTVPAEDETTSTPLSTLQTPLSETETPSSESAPQTLSPFLVTEDDQP